MRRLEKACCPQCGQEMEEGYIYSGRDIFWSEDEKSRIFTFEDETIIPLGWIKVNKAPAYKCNRCLIAIFEYNLPG